MFLRQYGKEDAKDWIINNQLGRRNLTDQQRRYLIGFQYKREKNKHGGNRGNQYTIRQVAENTTCQSETLLKTSERIGEQHKISERAVRENANFADAVDNIAKNIGEEVLTKQIKN